MNSFFEFGGGRDFKELAAVRRGYLLVADLCLVLSWLAVVTRFMFRRDGNGSRVDLLFLPFSVSRARFCSR